MSRNYRICQVNSCYIMLLEVISFYVRLCQVKKLVQVVTYYVMLGQIMSCYERIINVRSIYAMLIQLRPC